MQKILRLFIVNIIFASTIYAKSNRGDWNRLDNSLGSIIEVYDNEKKSNVIEFSSQSNRDTYINGAKDGERAWNNRESKTIHWCFKYSENYVIIIALKTIKGYRNLIYTASDKNSKSYIGLGSHTIEGEWVTVTRNLAEDLHRQDSTNKIISVNGFVIRGNGRITDVHMLKVIKRSIVKSFYRTIQEAFLYLQNREFISDSLSQKVTKRDNKEPSDKRVLPTITLINGEKIYLKIGEKFIEPGVIAKDSNGMPLDIEFIGSVNENQIGVYPIHYLAIDKNGNATSETRVIVVWSEDIDAIKVEEAEINKRNKELEVEEMEKEDENNSEIENLEEDEIGEDELEELYKKEIDRERGVKQEKFVTKEEMDKKLQNISIKLEDLIDRDR